jgi:DNA-binding response OmpR family regulator
MARVKVLIVSEDPAERRRVRAAVGSDVDYVEAESGREARRLAAETRPDVVVADETTEPFGAFGLARELKMTPAPPRVVILLERPEDAWLARWSGADRWLVRPVDPFELAEVVRSLAATPDAVAGSAR